uniref:Uncharacterized protein n=1 Tax=Rhizophagus irregularis (strain DAOM 181602 / DAOM 197198 / MUCL 43194) TaxID=747089 RepID=U9SW53_RHIID
MIDQTLKISETTADILSKKNLFQNFIRTHCRICHYYFQIKKCNDISCTLCKPIRLPHDIFEKLGNFSDSMLSKKNDDHYAAFNSVHNTETSERHRPSLVIALESAEHVPKGLLINTKRFTLRSSREINLLPAPILYMVIWVITQNRNVTLPMMNCLHLLAHLETPPILPDVEMTLSIKLIPETSQKKGNQEPINNNKS